MYLVHLGVLILLAARLPMLAAGAVGLAITIAYASASWYLLEKPLLVHGDLLKKTAQ